MKKTKPQKEESEPRVTDSFDAKKIQQLKIYKNNAYAAVLNRTVNGCELRFDPEFVRQNAHMLMTYQTPVQAGPVIFEGVNLPPYFAGLLPEGLRLKALTKRIKTSSDDLFSLLAAAGHDAVGDIHFSDKGEESENLFTDFKKIKNEIQQAIHLDQHALAGVQDKVSADRISLPITIKNKTKSYILKLASDEFPEIIQNEYLSLQIAKSSGLIVNKARVVTDINGVEALLVERFDRLWDQKEKRWLRHHQEDACQFLNRYPADKYNLSLQEIAAGIRKFASSPEIEVLKLLQLKAFSYLIGNGDLHAKNISLLSDQLSPCYDIVCTAVYGDEKMALMMDGKNQNLKRQNFIDFGKRNGLPPALVESMLDKMKFKFEKNLEKIFLLKIAKAKEKYMRSLFKIRLGHLE